eukprot:XP_011669928.1 PREDICTED: uncharacterized protein LOC105440972 [Strongylocentrotus purpuratus]
MSALYLKTMASCRSKAQWTGACTCNAEAHDHMVDTTRTLLSKAQSPDDRVRTTSSLSELVTKMQVDLSSLVAKEEQSAEGACNSKTMWIPLSSSSVIRQMALQESR